MGSVVVTGVASPVLTSDPSPAIPTTDFSAIPVSVTFQEGVTTGLLNISLPDNTLTSQLKVFQFSLTAVSPNTQPSPRLSAVNTTATITIVDDEGGAGLFQLSPVTITIAEGSSQPFRVVRSGESRGRVSVLLQTMQTGLATSGVDYQPFNQELIFESGQTERLMSVTTIQDDVPEGLEDFSITLSVPAFPALVNANAVSESRSQGTMSCTLTCRTHWVL